MKIWTRILVLVAVLVGVGACDLNSISGIEKLNDAVDRADAASVVAEVLCGASLAVATHEQDVCRAWTANKEAQVALVYWKSSNPSVVSVVLESGLVRAESQVGTATITATSLLNGSSASTTITTY